MLQFAVGRVPRWFDQVSSAYSQDHGRFLRTDSLPSTLGVGVQPWIVAITTATAGMGEHISAVAANATTGIRRRIELTPLLEHALVQAELATHAFAGALDERRTDAARRRADATLHWGN